MEALLKHVVCGLAQFPDQVQVLKRQGRGGAPSWDLRVAPEDFPRIVGRGGKTARALRALVENAFWAQGGDEYDRPGLNIMDPEDDGEPV